MKRVIIFCISLFLLGLTSSCRTYKTCPTYAKIESNQIKKSTVDESYAK